MLGSCSGVVDMLVGAVPSSKKATAAKVCTPRRAGAGLAWACTGVQACGLWLPTGCGSVATGLGRCAPRGGLGWACIGVVQACGGCPYLLAAVFAEAPLCRMAHVWRRVVRRCMGATT